VNYPNGCAAFGIAIVSPNQYTPLDTRPLTKSNGWNKTEMSGLTGRNSARDAPGSPDAGAAELKPSDDAEAAKAEQRSRRAPHILVNGRRGEGADRKPATLRTWAHLNSGPYSRSGFTADCRAGD
jgi:hypothetical protein